MAPLFCLGMVQRMGSRPVFGGMGIKGRMKKVPALEEKAPFKKRKS